MDPWVWVVLGLLALAFLLGGYFRRRRGGGSEEKPSPRRATLTGVPVDGPPAESELNRTPLFGEVVGIGRTLDAHLAPLADALGELGGLDEGGLTGERLDELLRSARQAVVDTHGAVNRLLQRLDPAAEALPVLKTDRPTEPEPGSPSGVVAGGGEFAATVESLTRTLGGFDGAKSAFWGAFRSADEAEQRREALAAGRRMAAVLEELLEGIDELESWLRNRGADG
jgi:hypothetical protein